MILNVNVIGSRYWWMWSKAHQIRFFNPNLSRTSIGMIDFRSRCYAKIFEILGFQPSFSFQSSQIFMTPGPNMTKDPAVMTNRCKAFCYSFYCNRFWNRLLTWSYLWSLSLWAGGFFDKNGFSRTLLSSEAKTSMIPSYFLKREKSIKFGRSRVEHPQILLGLFQFRPNLSKLFLILDGMQPSAGQRRAWRPGALANVRYLLCSSCFMGISYCTGKWTNCMSWREAVSMWIESYTTFMQLILVRLRVASPRASW